jgi:HK97 family phage prohead protease
MNKQYIFGEVKKVDDNIVVVASDETLDRYGEVIKAEGWELDNFKKHSPMLVNHDQSVDYLVGKWEDVKVVDNQLLMSPKWADTPKANEVRSLVEDGFLPTVSVGFIVKQRDEENSDVITKAELLEVSWVTIPANPSAMMKMMKKGYEFEMHKKEEKKKDVKEKKNDKQLDKKELEKKEEIKKNKELLKHYRQVIPEYRTLLKNLQNLYEIEIPEGKQVDEIDQIADLIKAVSEQMPDKDSQKKENLSEDIEGLETQEIRKMIEDITVQAIKSISDKYGI